MVIKKNLSTDAEREYIDYINQGLGYIKQDLDKQIVNFSEDTINNLFLEIHASAENSLYKELSIIVCLQEHAQEKEAYYYNKQDQSYNYDSLKYALRWLCALLVLGFLLYFIIVFYDRPKSKELDDLITRLGDFGINITRCSKNYPGFRGSSVHHYLEIKDFIHFKTYGQSVIARGLLKQTYQVHSDLYGWIKWSLVITGSFILFVISELFSCVRNIFGPNYKVKFEAWKLIHQRLLEAEIDLRKEMEYPSFSAVKRRKK